MWPLEAFAPRTHLLRVGAESVERYRRSGGGWSLVCREALQDAAEPRTKALDSAIVRALRRQDADEEAGGIGRRHRPRLHVLLESAWAPILHMATGRRPWNAAQLRALLIHRLSMLYGDADEAPLTWSLCVDHRAGDEFALGYGLPPSVRQALDSAAAVSGATFLTLQPAFAWGWQQTRRTRSASNPHWWIWHEQDRAMVARIDQGELITLNPAAELPSDARLYAGWWDATLRAEAIRCGLGASGDEQVVLAGWELQSASLDAQVNGGQFDRFTRAGVCAEVPAEAAGK